MRGRALYHLVWMGMLIFGASVPGCTPAESSAPAEAAEVRWWKGNLHTHSLWSDGDDYPEAIIGWYKEQGYDFVALSDHNTIAAEARWIDVVQSKGGRRAFDKYLARFGDEWVEQKEENGTLLARLKTFDEYRGLLEEPGRFLIIRSEEISDQYNKKPIHINAHNLREHIPPQGGNSVREVMQNNVDAVLAQRERTGQPMFPHINHPNFIWAVTAEDLIALQGERFFEVYNGHPLVNNEGDDRHPSTERMWDIILAERLANGNEVMYGLATDDSHEYHEHGHRHVNPGRGWVMVRAEALAAADIIRAMEAGDFYASTGVVLEDVRADAGGLSIRIRPEAGVTYTTQFIGTRRGYDARSEAAFDSTGAPVTRRYSDDIGVVLAEVKGTAPAYRFKGDELYVRAKIVSSKAKPSGYRPDEVEVAWTQPHALPEKP